MRSVTRDLTAVSERAIADYDLAASSISVRSVLKSNRSCVPNSLPKAPRPLMHPDDERDVSIDEAREGPLDLTDRERAIGEYISDAAVLYSELSSSTAVRLAPVATVLLFERSDPPMCIRMQVPVSEPIVEGDARNTFAAGVVDILLGVAARGGSRDVELFGPRLLDVTLAKYHKISSRGESMTVKALKGLMISQLTDLAQRCVGRMHDIRDEPPFNLNLRRAEMARDHAFISVEAEQDYVEDVVNRKPDVLTQRYMRRRVSGRTIGFDVNEALVRSFTMVLSSSLLVE